MRCGSRRASPGRRRPGMPTGSSSAPMPAAAAAVCCLLPGSDAGQVARTVRVPVLPARGSQDGDTGRGRTACAVRDGAAGDAEPSRCDGDPGGSDRRVDANASARRPGMPAVGAMRARSTASEQGTTPAPLKSPRDVHDLSPGAGTAAQVLRRGMLRRSHRRRSSVPRARRCRSCGVAALRDARQAHAGPRAHDPQRRWRTAAGIHSGAQRPAAVGPAASAASATRRAGCGVLQHRRFHSTAPTGDFPRCIPSCRAATP